MEDINALYKALEQADAAGDIATAQSLADKIRSLSPEDTADEATADIDTDVNSLYSLLEKADAAGDKATAQKLADQIRSLSPQEPVEETTLNTKTQPKPEDVGFLARAGESLKQGVTSFGDIKRGYELGSAKDRGDLAAAALKMQEIKTEAGQPVTPTLTAADINRIAQEKGLIPAGAQVPSYIVEQVLKSGPQFAVPLLTSLLVGTGTAMVTGPAAPVAAPVAATLAGIGAYGLQQYGNFMSTQGLVKKAPEDLDTNQARKWAAITAPLGFIVDRFVGGIGSKFGQKAMLNKMTQEIAKRKAAGETVTAAVAKEIGKATLKGTVKGISEMPTEMFEQAAEIIQAGGDITTEESKQQIFEAGWAGLAVGAGIGGPSNAYSKYREFKTEQQKQQQQSEQREEDLSKGRPSRDTMIDEIWKDIKSKAKPIEPEVTETTEPEVTTEPTTTLDKATLTSWGLNPRSNAFKALEGVDGSTEEGRDLINKTLEANKGKINESAVDDYLKGVESGRLDLGTATISDAVLGGQKYGTPGGIEGRYQFTTDLSGSPTELAETREETSDTALETIKGPEAKAKAAPTQGKARIMSVMEMLNQPDMNLRYEARRRYFDDLKAKEAEKYAKYVSKLKELAKKVSPTLPIIKQSNNLANVLTALKDPPRYLIEDLKNPNVIDTERAELNQQARDYITLSNLYDEYKVKMTPQEKKALMKEGVEAAKGESTVAPKELTDKEFRAMQDEFLAGRDEEPLESKAEGTPEGQAIVNSTKPANTLGQALSIIKRQHFNKLNPVQKVLHGMFETLPNVLKGKYKVMGMPKGEYGKYRSILNDTTISPKAGTDSIYHEGTHAATVWAVRRHVTMDKNGRPKAKGNSVVGQQLVDIFDAAEVAAMQEERTFGDAFKNMEEFVSYAFNDKDFQLFLAKQKSVAPTPAPKSSLWMDLMSAFNRLLGLDISNSLMSDIVSLAPELMTGERPGAVEALGPEVTLQHRSAQEMDEQLRRTGTVRPTVEPPKQPFSIPRKLNEFRKAAFSFDMAINKKILNALKAAGVSMEDYAKAFYQLAISQAVRADAMAAAFLHYGNINFNPEKYKFDITQSDISMKKINDILRDVAKRNKYDIVKMYQYASAAFIARRSQGLIEANRRLKAEVLNLANQGKTVEAEKLLRKNYKLVHMNRSEIREGLKFFNDIPELNQVYDIWNGVREKVLNFAVEQQLFTREKADDLLAIMDYVPFYTIAQLEARKGPKEFSNGLLDATKSKAFRGSHQEVNNVIDNMERWISYVIRKGINNHYAKNKIDLYKQTNPDDIRPFPEGKRSETGNTVTIWENGKTSRYEFQGPDGAHMVDGFTGLEPVMIPWLRYWSMPSKFLRLNIVLNPIFSLRQIPMDMFNAMTASGVKHPYLIPLQVIKEIALTPLFLSNARQELKKTITVGQPDYSKEFQHIDVEASKEAKKLNTVDKLLKAIMSPLTFLSMASDNVIRQAVYSQHMLETGDKALATNAAEEIINFRRTGSSQGIAIVRQIAPFVNANLQGLHINIATFMSDSINPLTRKQALLRYYTGGATLVGASLLYLALMADDDEYKKLDPTERDAFFILPNGYKIPMRYDLPTLLFKVIPEHVFNRFINETEDPTKFWKALKEGAIRALATPSIMPTFAAAPFEGYLNKDFTTNRDIVGQGLQGLEPELQFSPKNTSELARILAGNTVSPMQMDHFLQKYLATTMGLIAWITNDMIAENQGRQRPEKTFREKLLDIPNMSGFVTKLEGSRNINDFYELNQEVQRVVKSFPKYKDVSIEEAQKYLDKDNNRQLIQLQKTMDRISNFLSRLRAEENRVYNSTTMNAADKKAALDRIVKDRQEALGFKVQIGEEKDRFIQQLRKQGNL
jgi:Large polyvalent protein associated domain 38